MCLLSGLSARSQKFGATKVPTGSQLDHWTTVYKVLATFQPNGLQVALYQCYAMILGSSIEDIFLLSSLCLSYAILGLPILRPFPELPTESCHYIYIHFITILTAFGQVKCFH